MSILPMNKGVDFARVLSALGQGLMGAGQQGWGAFGPGVMQGAAFYDQGVDRERQRELDALTEELRRQQLEDARTANTDRAEAKRRQQEWLNSLGPGPMAPNNGRPGGMAPQPGPMAGDWSPEQLAYFRANPDAAAEIVRAKMFPQADAPDWEIKTIRVGDRDVTYRINPDTGEREELGAGAAFAPQQGPGMTERERNARAAGLQPGTPEYAQYILGRDDTAPGPFQGTSMDAQSYNMVLAGDPSTPEYAAAYAQLAMPKVTFDPVTQKMVMVAPDMSWARKPVAQGGQSGAVPPLRPGPTVENAQQLGQAPAAPFDVMQVPGATITSSAGGVKMSPEEATKFTALQEGAKDIQSAIDTLAPGGNVSELGVTSGQSFMGIEGIPFTAGRQSRQQMQRGIEAILRAMTGAAAPESEVQRYMGMFFPSPTDSDASAKEKLNAAKAWVDGITNLMKTGRPQLQGGETTTPGVGRFVPQLPAGDWK